MSLLGVDVGSGSCKAVVFGEDGTLEGQAGRPYQMSVPAPGRAEMDAEALWQAVVETIRELAQVHGRKIEALAIAAHGETVIAVDADGRPVGPALMNADNRAVEETCALESSVGREEIYRLTGLPPHPMFAITKIMWLQRHAPALYAKAKRFLSVEDYVLGRLGLPPYTDYSLACRTMAFDLHRQDWSPEILRAAGLRADQLGLPVPSGQKLGTLSAATAAALGLREGTIVGSGGHDQPTGALGAGVVDPGQVANSAGTYECLAAVSEAPRNTPAALGFSLNSYCHVVPGQYVTLAFFPAGLVSRWLVEQLCGEDRLEAQRSDRDLYDLLDHKAAQDCPGPTGLCLMPHFVGACTPHWDPRATGAIVGLTPAHTRYHLYKAGYEAIACELALNLAVLADLAGPFERVVIHGGNARSSSWVQLRADITGTTMVRLPTTEAVCRGAAMLAGTAAGVFAQAREAALRWRLSSPEFRPEALSRAAYAPQIAQYQRLFGALAETRNRG